MTNTSQKTRFHVQERKRSGKQANQLRSELKIPGNIYGLGEESQAVEMPAHDFVRLYNQEGDTGLIYLSVGDSTKEIPVLIDEVSHHPVSGNIQHVVFRRVNLKVALKAEVPVKLEGENKVPDTNIVVVTDSIEVEALPADIPEAFVINVETLTEVGQSISYADLTYDRSKVSIVFAGEETEESPVVILQEVKEEVVEEPAPAAEEEAGTEDATPATEGQDGNPSEAAKSE